MSTTHEANSLFNGTVQATDGLIVDTIAEQTAGSGVTIDGALIKDGGITPSAAGFLGFGTPATLAALGADQAGAAPIVTQVAFCTAADGTKGVRLPAAVGGMVRIVYNMEAANGLKIYPATGDDINDGTGDAAITIEGKTMAIFVALDTATWAAIYTANT